MKRALGCLLWIGAIVIGVGGLLKIFLFDIAEVRHNAMAPTILADERIVIYKLGAPTLGQIAICPHPTQGDFVMGRVIAADGMSIASSGRQLQVDGEEVAFSPQGTVDFYDVSRNATDKLTWGREVLPDFAYNIFLPERGGQRVRSTATREGQIYLLGDNRAYYGHDSRGFGPIDADSCRGTVVFRLTSADWLDGELQHDSPALLP